MPAVRPAITMQGGLYLALQERIRAFSDTANVGSEPIQSDCRADSNRWSGPPISIVGVVAMDQPCNNKIHTVTSHDFETITCFSATAVAGRSSAPSHECIRIIQTQYSFYQAV